MPAALVGATSEPEGSSIRERHNRRQRAVLLLVDKVVVKWQQWCKLTHSALPRDDASLAYEPESSQAL